MDFDKKSKDTPILNNIGMTRLDIIEAYIEMQLRDLDIQRELTKNHPDMFIEKSGMIDSARTAYANIYKFIATLKMKEQQLKDERKMR